MQADADSAFVGAGAYNYGAERARAEFALFSVSLSGWLATQWLVLVLLSSAVSARPRSSCVCARALLTRLFVRSRQCRLRSLAIFCIARARECFIALFRQTCKPTTLLVAAKATLVSA